MATIDQEIAKVGRDIDKVESEIDKIQEAIDQAASKYEAAFTDRDKEYWRNKEAQLRHEEAQLRDKEARLQVQTAMAGVPMAVFQDASPNPAMLIGINPRDFCLRSNSSVWDCMTNQQYDAFLDSLDDNGVDHTMFQSQEVFHAYKSRAGRRLDEFSRELSKEIGDVDLIAVLRRCRGKAVYEEFAPVAEDDLPGLPPCTKEKPNPETRKIRRKT